MGPTWTCISTYGIFTNVIIFVLIPFIHFLIRVSTAVGYHLPFPFFPAKLPARAVHVYKTAVGVNIAYRVIGHGNVRAFKLPVRVGRKPTTKVVVVGAQFKLVPKG